MNIFCSLIALLLVDLAPAQATPSPTQRGDQIATQMEQAREGFKGELSTMKMTLKDASGPQTVRQMEGKVSEEEKGEKSLSLFLYPPDVKGTKMLTWSYEDKDDDQWIYLPSMRRVKRISSSGRSASFMGSEFSYEDLGGQEKEKYHFTFLREEDFQGHKTFVVERVAKKESSYKKVILYVDAKRYVPLKVDYFNRRGELLKVALYDDFKSYDYQGKKFWRASSVSMKNVQNKRESVIQWEKRKLGVQFSERDFSKRNLK